MLSDIVEKIMAYELGMMKSEEEVIELYQELVDTGMAWSLQGSYGRTARNLILMGYVTYEPEAGEEEDAN